MAGGGTPASPFIHPSVNCNSAKDRVQKDVEGWSWVGERDKCPRSPPLQVCTLIIMS